MSRLKTFLIIKYKWKICFQAKFKFKVRGFNNRLFRSNVRALLPKVKPILFYAIKIDFGEGIEYFYSILNL
jgi:hypothetical protein